MAKYFSPFLSAMWLVLLVSSGFVAPMAQAQAPLTFAITPQTLSPTPRIGDTISLNVDVSNGDSIVSIQYGMDWDPALLRFDNIRGSDILIPDSGNFGFSNQGSSVIISWNANGSVRFRRLAGTIYKIRFIVLALSSNYWVNFSGNATSMEFIKFPNRSLTPTFRYLGNPPGSVATGLTTLTNDASVAQNQSVCVDVTARNFNNIFSAQWQMNWDKNVLRFDSLSFPSPLPIAMDTTNFGRTQARDSGRLFFSWNAPTAAGRSAADNAVLFRLCFKAIGAANSSARVSFTNSEIIQSSGGTFNAIPLTDLGGTVSVTGSGGNPPLNGLTFYGETLNANTGDTVCVKFRAFQFQNIATMQWTMRWDSSVVQFLSVSQPNSVIGRTCQTPNNGYNLDTISVVSRFNCTRTLQEVDSTGSFVYEPWRGTSGTLKFLWDNQLGINATIPDSAILYSVCFRVIGASGTNSLIRFDSFPIRPRVYDQDGVRKFPTYTNGRINVVTPSATLTLTKNITNVSCNGGGNGAIALTVSGGTGTYTYAWTGPNNFTSANRDITGLGAGLYRLTVTSGTQSKIDSFSVTQPTILNVVSTPRNVDCFGQATGGISLAVSGATPRTVGNAYTYSWAGPNGFTATTRDISNVANGAYSVTVTDSLGCQIAPAAITLTQPTTALSIGVPTTVNVNCNGGTTGSITVAATGGSAPYQYAWTGSNGYTGTGASISNLRAGTYNLTVTDSKNCTFSPAPIILTEPAVIALSAAPTVTNVGCNGASTGAISLAATGGTAPYQYAWTGPNGFTFSGTNPTGLRAGAYNVTITDARSCIFTPSAISVSEPAAIALSATPNITNVGCNGAATGAISLAATGGTAPYQYAWTGPNGFTFAGNSLSGLRAGAYNVTITDARSCTFTPATVNVLEGSTIALSAAPNVTNVTCNGASTGAISLAATGGTAPYQYAWTGPNGFTFAGNSLSGLRAGAYNVTITDARGCTFTPATVNISEPAALALAAAPNVTNAACNGAATGAISLTATGGTAPYQYAWTGPNGFTFSGNSLSGLRAGAYNVTITDARSCTFTPSTITVSEGGTIALAAAPNVTNVACNNGATGAISLTATGGNAPYQYAWTGPNGFTFTGNSPAGLRAGAYNVTITDARNCAFVPPAITVTEPAALALAAAPTVTNVLCNNGTTGAISLIATGGTAPYQYAWTGANGFTFSSNNPTGLRAGAYNVTITDARGCTFTPTAVTVTEPTALALAAAPTVTNVLCNNGTTGAISLTATGGTAPYQYDWTGANGFTFSSNNPTGLRAGTYNVTITDARGCTFTPAVITVTEPAALALAAAPNVTNILCNNGTTGTISLTATGGTAPYQYAWTGANGFTFSSNNPTGLRAGAYNVSITDARGCTFTPAAITITEPAALALAAAPTVTNVLCNNGATGAISLTATGGTAPYQYAWSGANGFTFTGNNPTSLRAGTYNVTITDARNCTFSPSAITITEPTALALSAAPNVTNILCNGASTGAISITATGGTAPYQYAWTGPNGFTASSNSLTALRAGTYNITITDARNCTFSPAAITVTEPAAIALSAAPTVTNILCNGASTGAISIIATGGTAPYQYAWAGANGFVFTGNSLTGLRAGTYNVTITDARNCTFSPAAITITEPAALALAAAPTVTNTACNGGNTGAISLNATGGTAPYQYAWIGVGNQNFTGNNLTALRAGSYNLTITDARNCTFSPPAVAVSENANITLTAAPVVVNVSCSGTFTGRINVTAQGGSGTLRYAWSGPNGVTFNTNNLSNLRAGTYTLTVSDASNCSFVAPTVVVTEPPVLGLASAPVVTNVACNGGTNGTINVNVNGGVTPYRYAWIGPNGFTSSNATLSNLRAGAYNLTLTDANNCVFTPNPISVTEPNSTVSVGTPTVANVTCNGTATGSISIAPSGGTSPYTVSWSGPNGFTASTTSITGLRGGSYLVTVTDANGCAQTSAPIAVTEPSVITLGTPSVTAARCGQPIGAISLTATGGTGALVYSWVGPNGFTSASLNLTALSGGSYTLTVRDANNCTATTNAIIVGDQPNTIVIGNSPTITNATCGANNGAISVIVTGGTGALTYAWTGPNNYSATTRDISALRAGGYVLTVRDANGCSATSPVITVSTSNSTLTISNTNITNVRCNGEQNGAINVFFTGGVAPLTFAWTGSNSFTANTQNIQNLRVGTYTLTITDGNGCTTTSAALSVTQPTALTISTPIVVAVPCRGDASGNVNITVSGGTPAYTYAWTGSNSFSVSTQNLSNVRAGQYTLSVTDLNTCNTTVTAIVTEPNTALALGSPTVVNVLCNGANTGSITIAASGSTGNIRYLWSGPNGFNATSATVSNLIASIYGVTATDANNCTATSTVTVTQPATALTVRFTSVNASGGANGSIDLTVTGGTSPYRYNWTGNGINTTSEDQTNLTPGTYNVTVTDANGCTATQSITITGTTSPAISVVNITTTPSGCPGETLGGVVLNFRGGTAPYRFQWRNATTGQILADTMQNLRNVAAGSYILRITDATGQVFNTDPIPVVGSSSAVRIVETSTLISPETCSDLGRIDITVSGGNGAYIYTWNDVSDNIQDRFGIRRGNYNVTVTDANGCRAVSPTYNVPYQPCALVLTRNVSNALCYNGRTGSIALTIGGGDPTYRVKWSANDSTTVSNAPQRGGTYTIRNLAAGSYTVTVTDANGLIQTFTEIVRQPDSIAIAANVTNDNGTGNGAIALTIIGGTTPYRYFWNTGQTSRDISSITGPSTRTVTVTDANGCSAIRENIAVQRGQVTLRITTITPTNVNCANDSSGRMSLEFTGGVAPYTFEWRNAQNVVVSTIQNPTGLKKGDYTVRITDSSTPPLTVTSNVITISSLSTLAGTVQTFNSTGAGLSDGIAIPVFSGGRDPYTITSSGGTIAGGRITGLAAGNYTVTCTDAIGCQLVLRFTIAAGSAVEVRENRKNTCFGICNASATVTNVVGAAAPFTYRWDNGETGATAFNLCSGVNRVTVTDGTGRTFTSEVNIAGPTRLVVNALLTKPSTCQSANGSIQLTVAGGVGPYTYRWNDPKLPQIATASNVATGVYFVLVTDANNCTIIRSDTITCINTDFCLRTNSILTPNEDTRNDVLRLDRCDYVTVRLEVYNRFGQLVWDNDDYQNSFEGRDNSGTNLPDGAYFVLAKGKRASGQVDVKQTAISLLRQ